MILGFIHDEKICHQKFPVCCVCSAQQKIVGFCLALVSPHFQIHLASWHDRHAPTSAKSTALTNKNTPYFDFDGSQLPHHNGYLNQIQSALPPCAFVLHWRHRFCSQKLCIYDFGWEEIRKYFSMNYFTVTPSPFFLSFESFFLVVFLMKVSNPPLDCSSSYLATNSTSFFFAFDK